MAAASGKPRRIDSINLTKPVNRRGQQMNSATSKLLPLAFAAILATLGSPVSAQMNMNTTIQEGRINTNDTYQRGEVNDNATYQEGLDNANRTRQRGDENWNQTGQFGKTNYNETNQRGLANRSKLTRGR
jgi:minor curlin subunit